MLLVASLICIVYSKRFLTSVEDLQNTPQCYGSIFDAGSSGTRVYVYQWSCREEWTLPMINLTEASNDKKQAPGLASFANNLEGIQAYLEPLINFTYSVVPENMYKYTPIMLGATAGLRQLNQIQQNEIIATVQEIFSKTKFYYQPEWVRVLTGQEEGMYMWMSVFYLLNQQVNQLLTLDLGGASTQNAFPYNSTGPDFVLLNVRPNVSNFSLYSVSYLGYGNDQARLSILKQSIQQDDNNIYSPCFQSGYSGDTIIDGKTYKIQGVGNLQLCQNLISQLLNTTDSTSINQSYEPPVTIQTVYGTNGIVTMAKFFNLTTFNKESYFNKLQSFTNLDWDQAVKTYPDNLYLSNLYFMGTYVYQLIYTGYNIPSASIIQAPEDINGISPSWTLAACSYQLAQINCTDDSPVCQFNAYSSTLMMFWVFVLGFIN
ncbi:unnamed protein product [Paramecium primaurelia]|uniref:Uncharacterized protein n=1 Tax=Paramecium primaurelia TaxID=5886 RepID=A0A8S1NB17_PARPR|nr:unnamed protein product [Paramecium primaurelia]